MVTLSAMLTVARVQCRGWQASRNCALGTVGGEGARGAPVQAGSRAGSSGSTGKERVGQDSAAQAPCPPCNDLESCWSAGPGSRCVARSVAVRAPFSVDATEVTRAQYSAWLGTNPTTVGQPPLCSWNTSFRPDSSCMARPSVCRGATCGRHPQPCVDWCDATAYCRAIGRRLCPNASWTVACSADGAYQAGYGTRVIPGTCNDYTTFTTTTVPAASKPGCQSPADSGFAGVFDMIGNVAEWVEECGFSGAPDTCKPRGLSFGKGAAAPICSQSTYAERSSANDNVGFRCCSL